MGLENFGRGFADIVRHAAEFDGPTLGRIQRVRGARIAVARLAYRPRIDQVEVVRLQLEYPVRLQTRNAPGGQQKTTLHVRVSEEGQVGVELTTQVLNIFYADQILVLVRRRAVD